MARASLMNRSIPSTRTMPATGTFPFIDHPHQLDKSISERLRIRTASAGQKYPSTAPSTAPSRTWMDSPFAERALLPAIA